VAEEFVDAWAGERQRCRRALSGVCVPHRLGLDAEGGRERHDAVAIPAGEGQL
jgi:hypothetical protein